MRFLLALVLCAGSQALAQSRLPNDLLLTCEGTVSTITLGELTRGDSSKFVRTYQLKNGVLFDPLTNIVWGGNCDLINQDEIRCDHTEIINSEFDKGIIKRRGRVSIKRDSGAMNFLLEDEHFRSQKPLGKPYLRSNISRKGYCRPSENKPLF